MNKKLPNKGSKELRKGRISKEDSFYFITTSCNKRKEIFNDMENFNIVRNSLRWLENKGYIDIHFFIAMPDHIHIVCQLTKGNLSGIMKSFKQYTGRRIK